MTNIHIPHDVEIKLKQFRRLILSRPDFKYARKAAETILNEDLHANYPANGVILEGLNCAMIISYCRPFSGNDKWINLKIPDLSKEVLSVLNNEEREIHDAVFDDRNKVLAHSDSSALDLDLIVVGEIEGGLVMPVKNYGMAPLTRENVQIFHSAATKLEQKVLRDRVAMEEEMKPYIRKLRKMTDIYDA